MTKSKPHDDHADPTHARVLVVGGFKVDGANGVHIVSFYDAKMLFFSKQWTLFGIFAPPTTLKMKKINTDKHLSTKKLFDVLIDTRRLYFESVEEDDQGNIILHKCSTINMGSGYGTSDEYFYLTHEEYEQYKRMPRRRIE